MFKKKVDGKLQIRNCEHGACNTEINCFGSLSYS